MINKYLGTTLGLCLKVFTVRYQLPLDLHSTRLAVFRLNFRIRYLF